MIGLDTNVLVRFLVQADPVQAAAAQRAGCQTLYTFDRRAARHNAVTLLVK